MLQTTDISNQSDIIDVGGWFRVSHCQNLSILLLGHLVKFWIYLKYIIEILWLIFDIYVSLQTIFLQIVAKNE